jgi:hypothetical protein
VRERWEPKGVGFLAVSLEPRREKVFGAVQSLQLAVPVAFAEGEILEPLGLRAVPSTLFISAQGRVVAVASGARSEKFFEARARELLGN